MPKTTSSGTSATPTTSESFSSTTFIPESTTQPKETTSQFITTGSGTSATPTTSESFSSTTFIPESTTQPKETTSQPKTTQPKETTSMPKTTSSGTSATPTTSESFSSTTFIPESTTQPKETTSQFITTSSGTSATPTTSESFSSTTFIPESTTQPKETTSQSKSTSSGTSATPTTSESFSSTTFIPESTTQPKETTSQSKSTSSGTSATPTTSESFSSTTLIPDTTTQPKETTSLPKTTSSGTSATPTTSESFTSTTFISESTTQPKETTSHPITTSSGTSATPTSSESFSSTTFIPESTTQPKETTSHPITTSSGTSATPTTMESFSSTAFIPDLTTQPKDTTSQPQRTSSSISQTPTTTVIFLGSTEVKDWTKTFPTFTESSLSSTVPDFNKCNIDGVTIREELKFEPVENVAVGWIEKDEQKGVSRFDELVFLNDKIEAGVLLHVNCSTCSCNSKFELKCNLKDCDKDCTWKDWSDWTECSETCGKGKRNRTRIMIPSVGLGKKCSGKSFEVDWCNTFDCPVDCQWSNWMEWSKCSAECDGGTRNRTRNANNPPATHGGKECNGTDIQMESCNDKPCHENCSHNKIWISDCQKYLHCPSSCASLKSVDSCVEPEVCEPGCKCRNGTVLNDRNECVEPNLCQCNIDGKRYSTGSVIPTGNPCLECICKEGKKDCVEKDCNCKWSNWSEWSNCSSECGEGTKIRTREPNNPQKYGNGQKCIGDREEKDSCKNKECPVCHDYMGNIYNDKESVNDTMCENCYCNIDTVICIEKDNRNINGQWSVWSSWSECSLSCGGGFQTRTRNCNKPKPQCNGKECPGKQAEQRKCNEDVLCTTTPTIPSTTTVPCSENEHLNPEESCEFSCNNTSRLNGSCLNPTKPDSCICKKGYYRDHLNNCVEIDKCSECYKNGKLREQWDDEKDKCIYYKCINNKLEHYNKSEECICQTNEVKVINKEKCCSCEKKPDNGTECKLKEKTEKLTINHPTFPNTKCISVKEERLSYCEGQCNSMDRPQIFYRDTLIAHQRDCKCCSGKGKLVNIEFDCEGKSESMQIIQFEQCNCKSCSG
ncbi:DgyrCDS3169 [Dimorphilus gyrociliatus]|uniref:DgyrCDS3169 n=1 Tax=Dimorphilus gyrociliatus TaxID=2664684 RepID=A0A7I8VF49_9ANNE|nr:DgyrCDS3169 [Dimorphilus gyrociliatus]